MTTIFCRVESEGRVLAVFPWSFKLLDGKNLVNGGTFECYSQAGQHSTCTLDYLKEQTKPIGKKDRKVLGILAELSALGYRNIVVINDIPKMFL